MARYRKIDTRIWNDAKFRSLSDDGKLAFIFVLTHPHMTSLGAMRATLGGLAEELGWTGRRLSGSLRESFANGMLQHDAEARFLWVPNFLSYNSPESPNVVRAWGDAFDMLPECNMKSLLLQRAQYYAEGMGEGFRKAFRQAFAKALAKGMPYPEPEPEPEQEREGESYRNPTTDAPTRTAPPPPPSAAPKTTTATATEEALRYPDGATIVEVAIAERTAWGVSPWEPVQNAAAQLIQASAGVRQWSAEDYRMAGLPDCADRSAYVVAGVNRVGRPDTKPNGSRLLALFRDWHFRNMQAHRQARAPVPCPDATSNAPEAAGGQGNLAPAPACGTAGSAEWDAARRRIAEKLGGGGA